MQIKLHFHKVAAQNVINQIIIYINISRIYEKVNELLVKYKIKLFKV